ncbi:hypothetical protein [Stutzerimonas balearica]|uniref:hypothetical protein n=1 Tax=Stutzerimonas balearica TaxID=74829 RepID=UPI00289A36E0|nr:hypothetical protein [Stutzerimonas balearica]
MAFADDVRRFAVKAGDSSDKIVRAVTLSLFNGIIRDTPVDTGRARGNWQTTVGQPASGEIDRLGASAAIAEVEAKTPPGAGQETYLANDLPYIEELEKGSSKQSPEGMVRRNIDRIERNLKRAIRDNKV